MLIGARSKCKINFYCFIREAGMKVSFDKIIMTKGNVLVEKDYYNQGLFALECCYINNNASSSTYMVDSYGMWHAILWYVNNKYIKRLQHLVLIYEIENSYISNYMQKFV